jgi:hypothetical protein
MLSPIANEHAHTAPSSQQTTNPRRLPPEASARTPAKAAAHLSAGPLRAWIRRRTARTTAWAGPAARPARTRDAQHNIPTSSPLRFGTATRAQPPGRGTSGLKQEPLGNDPHSALPTGVRRLTRLHHQYVHRAGSSSSAARTASARSCCPRRLLPVPVHQPEALAADVPGLRQMRREHLPGVGTGRTSPVTAPASSAGRAAAGRCRARPTGNRR